MGIRPLWPQSSYHSETSSLRGARAWHPKVRSLFDRALGDAEPGDDLVAGVGFAVAPGGLHEETFEQAVGGDGRLELLEGRAFGWRLPHVQGRGNERVKRDASDGAVGIGHGDLRSGPRCGARKEREKGREPEAPGLSGSPRCTLHTESMDSRLAGGQEGSILPFGSNPASLGEADECAVGDDEVIEKADVDEGQRAAELQRDAAVGLAGLGDAGRVLGCILGCKHQWLCPGAYLL